MQPRLPTSFGALFGQSFPLSGGVRLRLRMVHRSDHEAIRELLTASDHDASDLTVAHLLRADPRRRTVIVAAASVGRGESVVGVGSVELSGGGEPEIFVVGDDPVGHEVSELLEAVLRSRAAERARRVA